MRSAVKCSVVVLGLVLATATGTSAKEPQGHERQAPPPPNSAPAPVAVPRSAPPPPAPAPAPRVETRTPPPSPVSGRGERAVTRPVDGGEGPATLLDDNGPRQRRAGGERGDGGQTRAVPRGERPRGDRSVVGEATTRTRPPYTGRPYRRGGYPGWYDPGYYGYGYPYWYGYSGLGLGYFYYDPYFWGSPGYGYPGYGYGYGYGGYGPAYGGGYGGYDYGVGQLRLKVKPRDAEVYVDGYYMGLVDDFDGVFQRLDLEAGPHRVEIRKAGLAPLQFQVRIVPDDSITYEGQLRGR